jgi:methylmalonyl-CoA/ethylmalonyl-CoA epimerase
VSEPSLHHVGYVVSSINNSLEQWRTSLCATALNGPFDDPIQKARVVLLVFAKPHSCQVELVEPFGSDSPVGRFLQKGGGLHHLCFEVDDMRKHISWMKEQGSMLIRHPQPAVAFGERKIAWMRTREKLLVEFLERAF